MDAGRPFPAGTNGGRHPDPSTALAALNRFRALWLFRGFALRRGDSSIAPGLSREYLAHSILSLAGSDEFGKTIGRAAAYAAYCKLQGASGRWSAMAVPRAGWVDAESATPNFHFGILAEGAFALIPAASSDIHSLEMGHGVQYLHFDRDHSGFHPITEEPLAGGYFSPGFHLVQTPHLRYRLRFGQAAELRLRAGPNWQATEDTSGIESKWGGDFQASAQGTVMREWRWSARIPEKPRASPWRVGAQPGYILGRRHLPMAYSEILAGRVAEALRKVKKVETKKMMGGLCFMVEGKMALGILAEDLMVRLDPDVREKALKEKGCRERGFTGLPMKAFVFVDPQGTRTDKQLRYWVDLALEFNPRAKSSRKSR